MHISHNMEKCPAAPAVVIFGCGNTLIGDDGFGPAVIARLHENGLPLPVQAIDAGTAIREYLLDYLMLPTLRPALLIVVDAWFGGDDAPGQVRHYLPAELPVQKAHDFSLHQFPTVNLLVELEQETGIQVVLLVAQVAAIPDRIAPGLSPAIRAAVDIACGQIQHLLSPYVALEVVVP